jgi:glutathione S-transferase
VFDRLPAGVPFLVRPVARAISSAVKSRLIAPQANDHVGLWESELSREGFFAGAEFSAADIMMSYPVEAGLHRLGHEGKREAIMAWLAAIRARPAYQRALERGGAYALAG